MHIARFIKVGRKLQGEIRRREIIGRCVGEQRAALNARIPLGRLGQPADIAAAVAFLCSPDGAYITGQTLHVNGGMYMS